MKSMSGPPRKAQTLPIAGPISSKSQKSRLVLLLASARSAVIPNRALRITICGILELGEHSAAGVTHVLSILGPNGADPPELAEFAPHRRLVLRFHDLIEPLPDQKGPTRTDVEHLLAFGREVIETPDAHLLVHCRAGVSRSTAAATLIMMQANPQWSARDALEAVAVLRPRAWPNLLVLELGEALLRRNGEIVAAVGEIYRRVLASDPEFGKQMIDAGRRREISIALRDHTSK
jgi:predicted protein tyrosine phosphatase